MHNDELYPKAVIMHAISQNICLNHIHKYFYIKLLYTICFTFPLQGVLVSPLSQTLKVFTLFFSLNNLAPRHPHQPEGSSSVLTYGSLGNLSLDDGRDDVEVVW